MEKLEHPLWIVQAVNALLGPIVAAALAPLGFHFTPGKVIPDFLVMCLLIVLLVTVPILGSVLRSVFGKVGGSLLGGGIVGAIAWFVASSLLIAGAAAVIGFIVMLFSGISGRGGPGIFIPSGGGGFGGGGFGGGGGGFSGGGGSFGGGGASGGWN